jgi:hypothetical protein
VIGGRPPVPDQVQPNDDVGMSLMAGEEADVIIDLLRESMGQALRVTDCTTYVKLETGSGRLDVRFDDVADALGRPFDLGAFQMIFSSYYGRPLVLDDRIALCSDMTAGVIDGGDGQE